MITYRDMTFCPYHEDCHKGHHCPRALTEKVKKEARAWMPHLPFTPVAYYGEHPDCYQKKRDGK